MQNSNHVRASSQVPEAPRDLVIRKIDVAGYEDVRIARAPSVGLHAIIAVHSTVLGPSLGGLRMWSYRDEDEALTDVKRLSRGMTYKSAIAETGLGGGKAVIIGDPNKIKTPALYHAMGHFINAFDGRYITAEDVNTSLEDLEHIAAVSRHVSGLSLEKGSSGNPSPLTALGVFEGIRAVAKVKYDKSSLENVTVDIQGLGAVGSALANHLLGAGAIVKASERDEKKSAPFRNKKNVTLLSFADEFWSTRCDILAPCALGAGINDKTIPLLRARAIAGAANNQLLELHHGERLHDMGILYAPDYVINAGGIINVSEEFREGGYNAERAKNKVLRVHDTLLEIFRISQQQGISPAKAAERYAENILAKAKK